MKILMVIPYYAPAWDYGGPVRLCYSVSRELAKRGHNITVCTTDALDKSKRVSPLEELMEGVKVKRFRNLNTRLAHNFNLTCAPSMRTFLRAKLGTFDVLHMFEYRSVQNLYVYHYNKIYDVPYIVQPNGSLPNIMGKKSMKQFYDKLWGNPLLQKASSCLALNTDEAGQFLKMGIQKDKIDIIPNGIDLDEFIHLPVRGAFKTKWNIEPNQRIILFLGRIHKIKGLDILLKAFAGMLNTVGDAKLVIVGPDSGYIGSIKALTAELGIDDKVLFTGPLYGRDKLEAYVDAEVYVLPSQYDGFPTTVLEACACGVPVIVTDRCQISDIVNNRAGITVSYDAKQLADAMVKILRDNQLKLSFSTNGLRLVREEYNWQVITEKLESIYCRIAR